MLKVWFYIVVVILDYLKIILKLIKNDFENFLKIICIFFENY